MRVERCPEKAKYNGSLVKEDSNLNSFCFTSYYNTLKCEEISMHSNTDL
jgi:hypothetical protein